MLSVRNGRVLLFALAFVLAGVRTAMLVTQGRLNTAGMLGAGSVLLLLATGVARGLRRVPAPAPPGPAAVGRPPAPSMFAAPPSGPAVPAPAPLSAPSAVAPAPLFGTPAPTRPELTSLRSTRAHERPTGSPVLTPRLTTDDAGRHWGTPAAAGGAVEVLPQSRRSRRRGAPAAGAALPVPAPRTVPDGDTAPVAPQHPATAKIDLAPLPGDPRVGASLLAPARAGLHDFEPALVRSWLAFLGAGQRGEPAAVLKAGQLAVLAAGLEDAAVRRRLLRAVADPFADAVGLVTQDLPLDGLDPSAAPEGRVRAARELLLLVARTTPGTPAQGAAVRALGWLDQGSDAAAAN